MEPNTEGNLLEIIDLAKTLRQEQLFIQQEQNAFAQLNETLAENSSSLTKLAYICAQQRQNLNDLIISRPNTSAAKCCRRAKDCENIKFIEAHKILDYEHALAYEELFNYLYRSPYLLAVSLSYGDRLNEITPQHLSSVIHTITTGLYGNAINIKDVELMLKLLRELIELQIVVSDNPRSLLRANASSFARLYHRLNESMFSAKIFLTAALYEPIMGVLSESDVSLDIDPNKVIQTFSSKEKLRRFGVETSNDYVDNIAKFHLEILNKLYDLTTKFIESLTNNWSLFPSTLRWLVQTMCHQLKQAHFNDKTINEVITDMIFTHFICPAIVSPDIMGIIDAPISEEIRFNLIQISQIIQMLALNQCGEEIDIKFSDIYAKFKTNNVTLLISLLLTSQTGDDVVAILSQQSNFERTHLLSTQAECSYFIEFFRLLMSNDMYDINKEDRDKMQKILNHLPENSINGHLDNNYANNNNTNHNNNHDGSRSKDVRTKQSFISLGKSTKNKIAKTINFNSQGSGSLLENTTGITANANGLLNGTQSLAQAVLAAVEPSSNSSTGSNSAQSSPSRSLSVEHHSSKFHYHENEPVLIFNLYNSEENKLQPLTEEEVLKMNSIGQEIQNGETLLVDTAESCNLDNTIDKSSVVNGFDNIDGMSDVLRPLHTKTTRFSISHDDASIGNSDNLEAVSEAPSNHSVTSSLELEENDQNDNLSDMVSANVSGRGTPNISGRDTPSSQVTDGESVHNALTTPQMQKLISKARSDIEDKFCKFEIKKFEGDETVSIISDTWSTDVLASDSETVDNGDRLRDPLTGRRVSGGRSTRRSNGYFDASDQRSESNWSTEVLASDSEKLNDTDDNASITVKLDINHIEDNHFESMRRQRTSNGSFQSKNGTLVNSARNASAAFNGIRENDVGGAVDDDDDNASIVESCTGSERSQEDSTFFDAINSYEEAAAVAVAGLHRNSNDENGSIAQHRKYQPMSSLARSSVRTTNQLTGENSFQQNYKSSSNDPRKDPFLDASRMQRQVSADSSISNQSFSMDDIIRKPAKSHNSESSTMKKKHKSPNFKLNDSNDLIDFSDFGEEKPPKGSKRNSNNSNNNANDLLLDIAEGCVDDNQVEHRPLSLLQRTAGYDGRRNGIMAMKKEENNSNGSRLTPSLRRHQSLNYENHEIVLNVTIPNGNDDELCEGPPTKVPQTDDDKQQELLICAKTEELHLEMTERECNPFYNDFDSSLEATASTSNNAQASSICKINSNDANHKQNGRPTKATGAIPKSISFDASADKQCSGSSMLTVRSNSTRSPRSSETILRYPLNGSSSHNCNINLNNASTSNNSGLFNKLKKGIFKPKRNSKAQRHIINSLTNDEFSASTNRNVSFNATASEVNLDLPSDINNLPSRNSLDITEDILAKYRRKVSTSSEATNSDSIGCNNHHLQVINRKSLEIERRSPNSILHDKAVAFNIIKKKIRTVLSKTDLHASDFRHNTFSNAPPLLTYLRIQLAQALNLQNLQQLSYVSEAIRCISTLERSQHTQLLDDLQNDIQKRQNYLQYLMRYRQNLILIMENIEQFEQRLRSESNTCNRNLLNVCVRLFLEKRETKIETFQEEFARLTVSDDKIALIEEFIEKLMRELTESGGILDGMPLWQVEEARISIERILLHRMYQHVMFPNEDADLSRDCVLSEHIRKLQGVIHPSHPALCIPQEYLSEAPWLLAQQQLSYVSAYKTPKEKLQCVIRCISSIASLLRISSGRVPAADDILPVLIFVVIMTNPPYLLSTVEYISCFIGDKLDGEEEFNWTLFCSVVKFIKTMDYP